MSRASVELARLPEEKVASQLVHRIKRGEFFTVLIRFRREEDFRPDVNFMEQEDLFDFSSAKISKLKSYSANVQRRTFSHLQREGRNLVSRDYGKKAAQTFEIEKSWLGNFIVAPASQAILKVAIRDPNVISITENKVHRIPNPIKAEQQKILSKERNEGMTWGLERIGVPRIWSQLKLKGKGVKIGHLDTGADPNHPDLKGKIAGYAFFDQFGRQIELKPYLDTAYHGTHTAGTIVGGDSSGIAIGVAPEAKLYSAIVLPNGSGTTAQIVGGMEWLMEQDVRVMNLSLGGVGYDAGFEEILKEVAAANIFPAVSIGNEGLGVTGSPGNIFGAVGVGSVNADEEVSEFSGGGTLTWLDKVGGKHHVEKPDLVAPGEGIFSCIPLEYGQRYLKLSGTSMAAPHVAGIAALMVQKKKSATFPDLLRAMQSTAKRLSGIRSGNRCGFGLIQGFEALKAL